MGQYKALFFLKNHRGEWEPQTLFFYSAEDAIRFFADGMFAGEVDPVSLFAPYGEILGPDDIVDAAGQP